MRRGLGGVQKLVCDKQSAPSLQERGKASRMASNSVVQATADKSTPARGEVKSMPERWKAFFENIFTSNCRYWKMCPYFYRESYTCTHGGGDYCGFYRRLKGDDA